MADPATYTSGVRGPNGTSDLGWHMMSEDQGPQLEFAQDYAHEQGVPHANGAPQVLEKEQVRYCVS